MMFWSGVFMVIVSFIVFVMFCDPINSSKERGTWFEDTCAAVMMMGLETRARSGHRRSF
jgi:hypothetical protein